MASSIPWDLGPRVVKVFNVPMRQRVYYVRNNPTQPSTKQQLLSVPLPSDSQHVVLAMTSAHNARWISTHCPNTDLLEDTVQYGVHMAGLIRMPVVIVTNSWCDVASKQSWSEAYLVDGRWR
jgi:hypothetical protein